RTEMLCVDGSDNTMADCTIAFMDKSRLSGSSDGWNVQLSCVPFSVYVLATVGLTVLIHSFPLIPLAARRNPCPELTPLGSWYASMKAGGNVCGSLHTFSEKSSHHSCVGCPVTPPFFTEMRRTF